MQLLNLVVFQFPPHLELNLEIFSQLLAAEKRIKSKKSNSFFGFDGIVESRYMLDDLSTLNLYFCYVEMSNPFCVNECE